MAKRVTIMLDEDNAETLRYRQAQEIKKTRANTSFSKVINDVIRKGLKVKN